MQKTVEVITGSDFRRMITAAYKTFLLKHEAINSLNVFPVPDGDTGTNMLLTLGAAAKAVADGGENGIGYLSKRAADSAIMGARGNSGVILSQIFRGIARGLAGKEQATSSELGKAFQYGVLYAYRAVARPVEGTILTVAKGIAKGARRAMRENRPLADILTEAIQAGKQELARTPELLPVLRTAGVVDAGGQGLIVFLTGCLEGLSGIYEGPEADFDRTLVLPAEEGKVELVHPYCTEFIVKNFKAELKEVKQYLLNMGDSLVVAGGDGFVKVHIHTAHPGTVLESALTWGSLHNLKIDNMADQHRSILDSKTKSGLGLISVVSGEGLEKIMTELGVDIIVSGGQTMNPPVEDFINAVHGGDAAQYIILPNNKNILLAAAQAKKLLGDKVEILPTVNVSEGLAAIVAYSAEKSIEANIKAMSERIKGIKAAGITVAIRDSVQKGKRIPAGTFIGVINNKVAVDAADIKAVLHKTVASLLTAASEVISLYYGEQMQQTEAESLAQGLREVFPGVEVEVYYGGQPHYHFIISVE